jgi:hypothetical protein
VFKGKRGKRAKPCSCAPEESKAARPRRSHVSAATPARARALNKEPPTRVHEGGVAEVVVLLEAAAGKVDRTKHIKKRTVRYWGSTKAAPRAGCAQPAVAAARQQRACSDGSRHTAPAP